MATQVAVGFQQVAGFKLSTLPWGGKATVLGAGDGMEFLTDSLDANVTLLQNEQNSGSSQRLPGDKGSEIHSGALAANLYYRGLERMIASVFNTAGVPTNIEAGAEHHVFKLNETHLGRYGTLATDAAPAIREWPAVKIAGMTIEVTEDSIATIEFTLTPFGLNLNRGVADPDKVVVSIEPVDGAMTIAAQPDRPSPITILVTDSDVSITEYIVTIVGTNRDGRVVTEVYTLSADGLTFETVEFFKTVTTVTASGLAGTATGDTIVVGVNNGFNNDTTMATVTLPTERDFALFSDLKVWANGQDEGALGTADANQLFLKTWRLTIELNTPPNVTTRFGNKTDEPSVDGFVNITVGLSFSEWTNENMFIFDNRLAIDEMKMRARLLGPLIGATATPHKIDFYLNNLQLNSGSPQTGGPGRIPVDYEMQAARALVVPTGFPAGYTDAVTMEMDNSLATDPLVP